MSDPVLKLTDVIKTFTLGRINRRRVEAIKGVSLEVRKGDIYGFLGPNGAGKTTTVRCILGLSQPTSGSIERFGKKSLEPTDFFARTAYCPEESHFPSYLTGRELLSHWAGMFGVEKSKIGSRVEKALETVGLTEAASRRVGTYSKGMKQRIGIGGCLLSDPELIILDEPARGLDPLARHLVRNILLDLAKQGKTLFMNSHILSEVERVCTRAAIINNGMISKEFTMSDLEDKKGMDVIYRPGESGLPAPEGAEKRNDGSLTFNVADTAELARFVSQVAEQGGEVIRASRQKIDLEDYFIRVVEESKA